MSSTPFGDRLKRERELRGVTLEEVSAATKINPRYLEALEAAHWAELPGGAFTRGFIRSVSRFLGLDEDDMIAEYSLETKGVAQTAPPRPTTAMPRNWKPFCAAVAILIALLVCVFLGVRLYRARNLARHKQATALVSGQAENRDAFAGWGLSLACDSVLRGNAD